MRGTLIATGLLAAAFAAAAPAAAGEELRGADDPLRMQIPGPGSQDSGVPPPEMRLRAIVARALDDSIATWKRLVAADALEVGNVNVRFVTHLAPSNCFGLYSGDGPAYCSGNATVFVGVDAASRLMSRFGPHGEAGITFLIGHEIGHHIQNIFGRFRLLNVMARRANRADLQRRFELEADCFAGVWIRASEAWANSNQFRSDIRAVLSSIGDDTLADRAPDPSSATPGAHGTSEQSARWFERGAQSGNLQSCNTFAAAKL